MVVIYLFLIIILILLVSLFDPFEIFDDNPLPAYSGRRKKRKKVRFSTVRDERHYNIKTYDIIGDTVGATENTQTIKQP